MDDDARDAAIVAATVDLGHRLGLRVVGEGVATPASWEALAPHGCDEAQGDLLSRPLALEHLGPWLAARRARRRAERRESEDLRAPGRDVAAEGGGRAREAAGRALLDAPGGGEVAAARAAEVRRAQRGGVEHEVGLVAGRARSRPPASR